MVTSSLESPIYQLVDKIGTIWTKSQRPYQSFHGPAIQWNWLEWGSIKQKVGNPRWWPLDFKYIHINFQTIDQQNSNGNTHVFGFQLFHKKLRDQTETMNSKMAAARPKILTSQLVDMRARPFQRLDICFQGRASQQNWYLWCISKAEVENSIWWPSKRPLSQLVDKILSKTIASIPMFHGSGFKMGLVGTLSYLTRSGSPRWQTPKHYYSHWDFIPIWCTSWDTSVSVLASVWRPSSWVSASGEGYPYGWVGLSFWRLIQRCIICCIIRSLRQKLKRGSNPPFNVTKSA